MLAIGPLPAHPGCTPVGADSITGDTNKKDRNFRCGLNLVENTGIEPVTSCMPCKRSPS